MSDTDDLPLHEPDPDRWYPTWLTPNYLIDPDRYLAAHDKV